MVVFIIKHFPMSFVLSLNRCYQASSRGMSIYSVWITKTSKIHAIAVHCDSRQRSYSLDLVTNISKPLALGRRRTDINVHLLLEHLNKYCMISKSRHKTTHTHTHKLIRACMTNNNNNDNYKRYLCDHIKYLIRKCISWKNDNRLFGYAATRIRHT